MSKNILQKVLAIALVLLTLTAPLAALGSSVGAITLSASSAMIPVGESFTLTASVLPADADDTQVIWASGDTGIATVTQSGVVHGVAPGKVTIVAISHENSDISVSCTVTVCNPVTAITVKPSAATLNVGVTLNATVTVKPSSATVKDVIWSSDDPTIATVSSSGMIKTWAAGKVTITATAKDGSGVKGTCVITVKGTSATTPSPTPKPSTEDTAWVNTNEKGLNMRTGPGTKYSRRLVIPQYATVQVLSKGATWCHVDYNGKTGYVMTKFLSFKGKAPKTATPKPTATPKGTTAWVNTNEKGLNFRNGAGTNYARIGVIPQYATVVVLSKGTVWSHVTYDGKTGYVMTKYLSFKGNPPKKVTPKPTKKPSGQKAWVNTNESGLNLRTGPGTGYGRITVMPQYAAVTILTYGTEWSMIRYNGDTGYAMTQYLKLGTTKKTPAPTGLSKGYARVTTANGGGLNLRSATSTSSKIIMSIPNSAVVRVHTYGPTWCYVDYNGTPGYVMTTYLKVY